jgi:hypothetical protein
MEHPVNDYDAMTLLATIAMDISMLDNFPIV